jgi:transcriptional regulator with XRE-family HTH domain
VSITRELPTSGAEYQRLRVELGISKAELARRVSCDVSSLWQLEHDGPVSERLRLLVAAALGLPVFPPVDRVHPS